MYDAWTKIYKYSSIEYVYGKLTEIKKNLIEINYKIKKKNKKGYL
jgi:hypothetical protein